MNKKGFIGLWTDVFKGLGIGIIIGIILAALLFFDVFGLGINFCGA
jgi:hypothetical protein